MPQSVNVRQSEIQNQPEHAADTASTHSDKAPHLSAHEETVQTEDHSHNSAELQSKLHHGKAAALEAAKQKK